MLMVKKIVLSIVAILFVATRQQQKLWKIVGEASKKKNLRTFQKLKI